MKRTMFVFCVLAVIGWGSTIMAADHMSQDDHGKMGESDMKHIDGMKHGGHDAMGEHGEGRMEGMAHGDTFKHRAVVEGVGAGFEIMSLASMNMKDPEGNTHHIMVKLHDNRKQQIEDAIGNIKVIGPDKQAQTNGLKNYAGIYAANVTFNEPGKYGIICLVKVEGKRRLYKFWYPHK
jgi:hypothetical protein